MKHFRLKLAESMGQDIRKGWISELLIKDNLVAFKVHVPKTMIDINTEYLAGFNGETVVLSTENLGEIYQSYENKTPIEAYEILKNNKYFKGGEL